MKNLNDINHFLTRSLRWIGFEAIAYQLVLLAHQLVLFRMTDHATYGLIGATFSLVFLAVGVADCGCEMSISPFFSSLMTSRLAMRRFMVFQLVPGVIVWLALSMLVFFIPSPIAQLSVRLVLVFLMLVLIETIKKPLRTMMHLAFLNRDVAFIEVGTVLGYIGCVWLGYAIGIPLGLHLIFIPMVITSFVALLGMIIFLFRFTKQLPCSTIVSIPLGRIVRLRVYNFMNFFSHQIFSSNFLVPFFAVQFGLAYAGVFKLVSHVAYCVTTIIRKIFGLTSDAVLAAATHLSLSDKQIVFSRLTQRLHAVIYALVIFFGINYSKLTAYTASAPGELSGPLMYLFLVICFSETLFIAYEKFYITHECAGRLLLFNCVTMLVSYAVIQLTVRQSLLFVLTCLVITRLGMFALLGLVSFYTWRIRPTLRISINQLLFSLSLACSFFFLF